MLLGVEKEDETTSLFPFYIVTGIPQDRLDKIQLDLANQCAENFNIPVRSNIVVEKTAEGASAIIAFVDELSVEQKPLFLKSKGLPQGAYRRIGSADHKCTEDDLVIFYQGNETLHHLLNEEDIQWLDSFGNFDLNDNQKRILIFVREVNVIDYLTARQINGSDTLVANYDLRKLRELDLLNQKGKSKFTYYTASDLLKSYVGNQEDNLSAPPIVLSAPVTDLSARPKLIDDIPKDIIEQINNLGKRTNDKERISSVILQLCVHKQMKSKAIANTIGKSEKYILREFLKPLLDDKRIKYAFPEMINHPEQAYVTVQKGDQER